MTLDDKHHIITLEHSKEHLLTEGDEKLTYHRQERFLGKATRYGSRW